MIHKHRWLALLPAALSTLAAHAQESGSEGGDDSVAVLDEIMVTAQRRQERLQDLPLSITAFSAETIEAAGFRETRDILVATPNVDFTTQGRGFAASAEISIRGIGSAVRDTDRAVAVYLDDVYLGHTAGINLNLVDLERVEVLRGPQGTLYGRNALAGAVNFVSREPQNEPEGSVELSYGNYDYMRAKAMGNLPLVPDKLLVRANVTYSVRDGTVENLATNTDVNEIDNAGARLQIKSKITDALTLNLSGDYTRDRIVTGAVAPISIARNHENNLFRPFDEDRDSYGAAARFTYDTDRFQFLSISGHRSVEDSFAGSYQSPTDVAFQGGSPETDQREFSQEFRLVSAGEGPLEWVVGAYYFDEDKRLTTFYEFHELATIFSYLFGDPTGSLIPQGYRETSTALLKTEVVAGFADLTYSLTERLDVTLGARYGTEDKSMDYGHTAAPFLGFPVFSPTQSMKVADTFDSFLPKLTLNFRVSEDALVYGTVSRGFKSGGFNYTFLPAPVDANGVPIAGTPTEEQLRANYEFQPEKLWNYELGFKGDWMDNQLVLNGAVFYMDWENQQLRTWVGTHFRLSNADKTRSYGAELELLAQPTSTLRLSAGVGYNDATFRSDTLAPDPFTGAPVNIKGNRQPNSSKVTGNLSAQYAPFVTGTARMPLRADIVYRSSQHFDEFNTPQIRQGAYTVLNLRAGLETDTWGVYLFGSNITDEKYFTSGYADGLATLLNAFNDFGLYPVRLDEYQVAVADPRTYGITAHVRF